MHRRKLLFGGRYVTLKFKGLDEDAVYNVRSEHRKFKKAALSL